MENFIPFIIGIAFFIYKTWANFREEQKKARKRNPSVPVVPPSSGKVTDTVTPRPQRTTYNTSDPFLAEETANPANPYEPAYKSLYQPEKSREQFRREEKHGEKVSEFLPGEGYNPEQPNEEVKRNRAIHNKHQHQKKLQVQDEESAGYHFDMKDAIIKEAILNRPQY